jgi:metal-dependent amidase/aminoacylase/carboxypeptidase family protein
MKKTLLTALISASLFTSASASELAKAIAGDYDSHLGALFDYFHRNPELSYLEVKTAARLAQELRAAGFEVTEKVGGTGVVAILKNGPGPLVMMRADMDGLPVLEKSGLPYASTVVQKDPGGREVPVAHSCGHFIHMTSLVGGANLMMKDDLWKRFGRPDYALALHVASHLPTGKINVDEAPFSSIAIGKA